MRWISMLVGLWTALHALFGGTVHAAGAAESMMLRVTVNGDEKGDFLTSRVDDTFLIRADDLRSIGLQIPSEAVVTRDAERVVSICQLEGVNCRFDVRSVSLALIVPSAYLTKTATVFDVAGARRASQRVYSPRETSVFLNYNLTHSFDDPVTVRSTSLANKVGFRSGSVLFLTDTLYTRRDHADDLVRLMSSVTYDRREELQIVAIGDAFATSGELGSVVNLGGLSISKVYRMDPNLIKYPMVSLNGVASFPSQVEVYRDGRPIARYQVEAGPFDLRNFYYPSGAQQYELVIRDMFGNEQRIVADQYFSDMLLRKGFHEYSYNAGFLREQYGEKSNEYGDPVLVANHRYGISEQVTLGGRAEVTRGLRNGGATVAITVPRFGVVAAHLSESRQEERSGVAGALQYRYQRKTFSASLAARGYTHGYANVATKDTVWPLRHEGSVTLSYGVAQWGTLSAGYSLIQPYPTDQPETRVTSVTLSKSIGRNGNLTMSGRMFRTDRSDYEVFVGYAHAWGSGVNIASSVQKSENTNTELLQVYNRMPIGEGVGFQASMSRFERDDQSSYVFSPYVQYNAPYGIYTLDAQVQSGTGDPPDRYRLSAAGSLVYVGGMFGAARPVNDSFTIVLLDDLRDVDVSVNNERIGSTDARGRLVVPSMKSYYHNQISIDADNIPFEYSLGSVHTKVAPSAWSGSCYSFDAQRLRALTGVLVLASAGEDAVAEFASVTLSVLGREVMFETGAGGEFYVENRVSAPAARDRVTSLDCASIVRQREEGRTIPAGTYPAVLSYQGKRCEFDLTFPDTDDVMTDVGTIRCSP